MEILLECPEHSIFASSIQSFLLLAPSLAKGSMISSAEYFLAAADRFFPSHACVEIVAMCDGIIQPAANRGVKIHPFHSSQPLGCHADLWAALYLYLHMLLGLVGAVRAHRSFSPTIPIGSVVLVR